MVEGQKKKIVVVLGMHRSGTSAVARGLQVLGVELGNNLMPAIADNNDKGFWEDIDLTALNVEILSALGCDWHNLAPVQLDDIEVLYKKKYFFRAVELLHQKIGDAPVFGFKDPRVAKLLPFWKDVFSRCELDVSYVITLRHPLSVVKSLLKRDGLDAEKSYLLWLGHIIAILNDSAGAIRMLVNYDRLMKSPDRELQRIAECVGLQIDPEELQKYKSEFLDQKLQHTVFDMNDLLLDNACPPIVHDIYVALLEVGSDKMQLDDPKVKQQLEQWAIEFNRLKASLTLIDRLYTHNLTTSQAVLDRDRQISDLLASLDRAHKIAGDREGQIFELNQVMVKRDERNAYLQHQLDDTMASLDRAHKIAGDREGQIINLQRQLIDVKADLEHTQKLADDRSREVILLNERLIRTQSELEETQQTVRESSYEIKELKNSLNALRNTLSWRITAPLRWLSKKILKR